jgi:hypothetical protein
MKIPTGKIDENKNSISIISKTNNLIKVYYSEKSNPESRNINNGLLSNHNSSKCSEFEEKILEIGDECIQHNIQKNANAIDNLNFIKNTNKNNVNNNGCDMVSNSKYNNNFNENAYLNVKVQQIDKEIVHHDKENSHIDSKYSSNRKNNGIEYNGEINMKNSNEILMVKLNKKNFENEKLNNLNKKDQSNNCSNEAAFNNFL